MEREHPLRRPDGATLHLRVWTEGGQASAAPPLVIAHGLGEHAGRYAGWAGRFVAEGFTVVAYDQRGHGRSSGRRGVLPLIDPWLDDLEAVGHWAVEWSGGSTAPILYGHSFGGLVALRTIQTGRGPWDRLVLSAPWLGTAVVVPTWKQVAGTLLARLAPSFTLSSGLDPSALSRVPEAVAAYCNDPLVHDRVSAGLVEAVESAQAEALAGGLPDGLYGLVLLPTADRVADPEVTRGWALGRAGPGVTLEELEGGLHEPHHDQDAARVFARVRRWLGLKGG